MKKRKMMIVMVGLVAIALIAADAQAYRITTADTGGADAELRESAPTQNRGTSTELASRVDYGVDEFGEPVGYQRNSVTYLKFGVQDFTSDMLNEAITIRLTYMNNSISSGRIEDSLGGANTGIEYFVLDPTITGANWDEGTIAPTTDAGVVQAPAYDYDGDTSTKPTWGGGSTPTTGLTYLGQQLFDSTDLVNGHMPVGGAFDFTLDAGSVLHQMIEEALATEHQTLTIVFGVIHDYTAETDNPNWIGFNYVFNSKEQTTLKDDPDSLWSGMANDASNGYVFSPMLTNEPHIIPEPATMALLGLGGLFLRRKRK